MKAPLAIATSSVSASAHPFLDRTGIKNLFNAVVTGDEVERGKPHPDIYLRTSKELGVSPQACLVIEDALTGVAAAKAAHMRVAAIPDTRFMDPRDYEKEADYVLGSLSEIPALIRRIRAAARKEHVLG
jgi:beta-phosphoglucomutase-like phosphatase (HAD superfamily)